jgi:transcription initiation factor TFIIIB Brf1 subunit/transcription initiation factor TFIIB
VSRVDGELRCTDCGLIVEDQPLDQGALYEQHNPDDLDSRSSRGVAPGLNDKQTHTYIGHQNNMEIENLPTRKRSQFYRMKQLHRRDAHSESRGTNDARNRIKSVCSELELPDVTKNMATSLFSQMSDRNFNQGRVFEVVAEACVYIAIRNTDAVRTLNELAAYSAYNQYKIANTAQQIQQELDIPVELKTARDYVPFVADKLNLNAESVKLLEGVLGHLSENGYESGREPLSFISGVVYWLSLTHSGTKTRTSGDITDPLDICSSTIRTNYKHVKDACTDFFNLTPEEAGDPSELSGKSSDVCLDKTDLELPDEADEEPLRDQVEALTTELELSELASQIALKLVETATESRVNDERSPGAVASGCVYIAIQNSDPVRTLDEIAAFGTAEPREIIDVAQQLQDAIDLSLNLETALDALPAATDELAVDKEESALLEYILAEITARGLDSGRMSHPVIGGVFYWLSLAHERTEIRSAGDIADALGISRAAVRENYKRLKDTCADIFDISDERVGETSALSGKKSPEDAHKIDLGARVETGVLDTNSPDTGTASPNPESLDNSVSTSQSAGVSRGRIAD